MAYELTSPIYLDVSAIDWQQKWRNYQGWPSPYLGRINVPHDFNYTEALWQFEEESPSAQRALRETLQDFITMWREKTDANRRAVRKLKEATEDFVRVTFPESGEIAEWPRLDLIASLEVSAGLFEKAALQAEQRREALRVVMARRAMLGPEGYRMDEYPNKPHDFCRVHPGDFSKEDVRNCKAIMQLVDKSFSNASPTEYFRKVGKRCADVGESAVNHATINAWFHKMSLYHGRDDDQSTAELKEKAEKLAKRVLMIGRQNGHEV